MNEINWTLSWKKKLGEESYFRFGGGEKPPWKYNNCNHVNNQQKKLPGQRGNEFQGPQSVKSFMWYGTEKGLLCLEHS